MLGAEVGALLGYISRKVLGQFDLFVPPDDDGTIYFVGPNIAGIERQHQFPEREFRLWLALHEVAHRLQFGGVPWLRGHVTGLAQEYLRSMNFDMKFMIEMVRKAAEDVRAGRLDWRSAGWVVLLMTPEQRALFAADAVGDDASGGPRELPDERRGRGPGGRAGAGSTPRFASDAGRAAVERSFQRAIGFDQKTRQYDHGERFVARAVERGGMSGFNRVWESPENLPTMEELSQPDDWLARIGAG